MGSKVRSTTSPIVVLAFAVLLCVAALSRVARAQKTATVKPKMTSMMVPDNPSEHPAPEQPIPYSHKQHLALGLQCKECHTSPEPGKQMTFPSAERCMQCHVTIAKDKPSIQKIAQYAQSKEEIPWVRVYKVLPGVNWSHQPHLAAGVKCETCHGRVAEMATMSEVTSVTTMYVCLHCHELNHAKAACDTCHKQ
jgi:Cytochrome c3/Cytochrome c7 and related cytochrome c